MSRRYLLGSLLIMNAMMAGGAQAAPTQTKTLKSHSVQSSGVIVIDVKSTDEKFRQYLLPLSPVVIKDRSDSVLHDFINEKMKWEKND